MITMEGILPKEQILELRQFSFSNDVGVQICENFNARFIIQELCDLYNVSINDVLSASRKAELVKVRRFAMYLIKEIYFNSMSLKNIGSLFGNRDHSTVIHAIETLNDYMRYDIELKRELQNNIDHFNKLKENYENFNR